MDRRSYLSSSLKAIFFFAVAGLPFGIGRFFLFNQKEGSSLKTAHAKIRPPGAPLKDEDFLESCINCTLCADACPPACIKYYSSQNGGNSNTPYIDPSEKACTLCGKCMEICPTNALTVTKIRDIKMGTAVIERLACYPWVDTGICGACVSICPIGERAIGFDFANVYRPIIKDGCVGCGLCVEACPHPSLPIRVVKNNIFYSGV